MGFDVFESMVAKFLFSDERFWNVVLEVAVGVQVVGSVDGFGERQIIWMTE